MLYARAVNIFSTHPGHISVAYVQMALLGCLLAMFSLLFLHSSRRRLLCGVCVGANVLALACFL
ncbi:MAG: hypothetical protein EBV03_02695 [Proteobacteria bacterium]|nr:hypothetical protein [Pseudomonadota bacterium]